MKFGTLYFVENYRSAVSIPVHTYCRIIEVIIIIINTTTTTIIIILT